MTPCILKFFSRGKAMDRDHRERVQKPPPHRRCDYPSFSSTLLDSIYRSIDDETNHRGEPDPSPNKWIAPPATRPKPPRGAPDRTKKEASAVNRQQYTSSSSDCSSYGGFSSSEPESVPARVVNRLKPIRTGSDQNLKPPSPAPMPTERKKKNKNLNAIRSKFRELKKSRLPTSPAARLAGFLNSLFSPKQKTPSTASSVSRSCLVKTPPAAADNGVKRSVRFEIPDERREVRRMTWRDLEEEDDDDVSSDASSDLFELENLTAIGRYRDELPVYETTHLGRLVF